MAGSFRKLVGAHGLEPWTSSLSETRSNQLSYAPALDGSLISFVFSFRPPGTEQCSAVCLASASRRPSRARDASLLVKEVIQPQVPLRLPCYDFIPVIEANLDACAASGGADFHDVTGGVYKARERIQGAVADVPLLAIPTSCSRVADCSPNWGRL